MTRVIRNVRAQQLQGARAGVVSRVIAAGLDLLVAFGAYIGLVAGVSLVWDLFFSSRIVIPRPSGFFTAGVAWAVLVVYWWVGWGSTGRSIGKQVMGLRVVRADGSPLRGGQALGRAVLCASFYPGLALALFDRRNRALEDIVCRTVVVYDWIPESTRPRRLAAAMSGETRA